MTTIEAIETLDALAEEVLDARHVQPACSLDAVCVDRYPKLKIREFPLAELCESCAAYFALRIAEQILLENK